jgi:hypothetical protein
MKRVTLQFLFLTVITALTASIASAQMPDSIRIEFDFDGFGNLVLMSPPVYSGAIYAGDPLVVGATWTVNIDDTGWPTPDDPAGRWDYIFTHYFVYDPGSIAWTAHFDATNLPAKPDWEIIHPTNGTMNGTLVLVVTLYDMNMNGILDLDERMIGLFSGTLMVMKYGTGLFAGYCGEGSYNGSFTNPDPANWADDYVEGHCLMDLLDCSIGTKEQSWSYVKKRFK